MEISHRIEAGRGESVSVSALVRKIPRNAITRIVVEDSDGASVVYLHRAALLELLEAISDVVNATEGE